MTGTRTQFSSAVRQLGICIAIVAALSADIRSAHAVVVISDGFGDADRNNDGSIGTLDTDLNDSGTFNDATADAALIARGITEVTAATDASDVGIAWSGMRSFDTAANLVKSKLRIINDNIPIGVEASTDIHNDGLALGVESRGGGSSFMGRFGQSIALGANAGDRLVVSFDWRHWREANDNVSNTPGTNNELRWGLYQDTDGELGQTGPFGNGGATVMWGRDDGNFFASGPGAEGDKGINVGTFWGSAPFPTDARIRWEYNLANINGGTNNGRILEGNGVTDTPGGGDTATIATPNGVPPDGPGGVITDLTGPTPYAPHNLKMEIVRMANGLVEVASFVDNVEILRDDIKTTDTGYNVMQPIPFTYDYVAIRNANNDWDYVIDNFQIEAFTAGVQGDYNGNGAVDAADYVMWRKGGPLLNEVDAPGTVNAADYTEWRARFGNPGSGAGLGGVIPEPTSALLLFILGLLASAMRTRRHG